MQHNFYWHLLTMKHWKQFKRIVNNIQRSHAEFSRHHYCPVSWNAWVPTKLRRPCCHAIALQSSSETGCWFNAAGSTDSLALKAFTSGGFLKHGYHGYPKSSRLRSFAYWNPRFWGIWSLSSAICVPKEKKVNLSILYFSHIPGMSIYTFSIMFICFSEFGIKSPPILRVSEIKAGYHHRHHHVCDSGDLGAHIGLKNSKGLEARNGL